MRSYPNALCSTPAAAVPQLVFRKSLTVARTEIALSEAILAAGLGPVALRRSLRPVAEASERAHVPHVGPPPRHRPQNNTVLHWRAHGLPIRTHKTPVADLHYIGRELESMAGGEHTVVVFTIWAHFTTHPLDNYIRRLATIRRAVRSLLQRAPRTLVAIKTANTGYKDVYGSDWLSWQLDLILRAMFRNLPVVFIDAWQMTSCHYSPDNIHPPRPVVMNEVDLLLSFVCPQ
ncbi:hypothetical protein ANANG_G00070710 [Anguilla anguilla]|uniref:NXPE C-terminal domain-containing protein n=1 Tax=Anguilla anguilla TaxID=7936 RepID=A0A9D3S3D0_ANGAN|nr:hypothetical protein ANANG_G00070710 [Anguilla anguilla]